MPLKSAVLIVASVLLAATLLSMRQHRVATGNQMILLHREIQRCRQSLWDLQLEISRQLEPNMLMDAIAESRLQLEPIIISSMPETSHLLLASANDHRRVVE